MQVKDIMSKNVITTNPEARVSDVAKLLHQHKIHGIPVVDGKHLVGIITETDFFIKGEVEIHLPSLMRKKREKRGLMIFQKPRLKTS
jgi:predicted transcriptional regulator